MTREECIKWLKSLKTEIGKSEHGTLWHYAESIDTAIESLSAEAVPQLNRIDTLIIANALRYLAEDEGRHPSDMARAEILRERILQYGASMCKDGDAESEVEE